MKTGKLSLADRKFIEDNSGSMTPEEIGKKIGRLPETVVSWQTKLGVSQDSDANQEKEILEELLNSSIWAQAQETYTADELNIFKHDWVEIVKQFREDVLFTEKSQICDLIMYNILIKRALLSQREKMDDIKSIDDQLKDMLSGRQPKELSAIERPQYEVLMNLKHAYAMGHEAYAKVINDYQAKKYKIFEGLKTLRADRIKDLKDARQSIHGLIRQLQKAAFRQDVGEETILMDLAAEKEKKRFSQYHEFRDNTVDRMFLTPESVMQDEEELQRSPNDSVS